MAIDLLYNAHLCIMSGFVHLHVHSEYSLLSGLADVESLVAAAKAQGYTALALTDTDRMSGLILFHRACLNAGMRPILGVRLTDPHEAGEAVLILARDAEGYGDLCELITQRHLDAGFSLRRALMHPRPHVHVVCGHGELLRALASGPNRPRLHGELLRRTPEEKLRSAAVAAFCDAECLPSVASGGVYFLRHEDHELHRLARAIAKNDTLARLPPEAHEPSTAYLMPPAAMRKLFADRPQALAAAATLADDCRSEPPIGKWIMPRLTLPDGVAPEDRLRDLAMQGLQQRYGGGPDFEAAHKLQAMELEVITKLGYASYFLMVREVCDAAGRLFATGYRRADECTLLRGSAANSITFYNLGASQLDPIAHDLYFQRFLNEDRASPPDADLDFGWDERDAILNWVRERFGDDRVAVTCTMNRFHFQSAFREAAKALGHSEAQITALLDPLAGQAPGISRTEWNRITALARRLERKPHFLGQHPGGLLITNEPIFRHVACERSGGEKNRIITQIDMHSGIDDLGLIKFDLLGNGSLSVYRDALEQLRRRGIPDPPVHDLATCFSDARVLRMMQRGRTRGIFYIESPAQIRLNQKCRAETFEEITITSSLVRPAGTAYAKTFVERHRQAKAMPGRRDWHFLHPSLEHLLHATHDVCAFQEDVTKICHQVAGLSFKEADQVRKMMNSHHDGEPEPAIWRALEGKFKAGCQKPRPDGMPGLTPSAAAELWQRVSSFKGFSFCKSHSASYAQLSFRCAYLKAYYPAAFMAAVISNNHGFYRREVYLDEARRFGVRVLPLDINASQWKFSDEGGHLRPGFLHLHGLGQSTYAAIEAEREAHGPFRDFDDFLRRIPARRQEIENLVMVGAFDSFRASQPELLFHLYGRPRQRALGDAGRESRPPTLFDAADAHLEGRESNARFAPYNLLERCMHERSLLGYMLSADPVEVLAQHPRARHAVAAMDLPKHKGRKVTVLGSFVTERFHPVMKSGRPMYFLTLADVSGMIDVIFWPDQLERFGATLSLKFAFEVRGKVTEDFETFSLEAEWVRPVAFAPNAIDYAAASQHLKASATFQVYTDLEPPVQVPVPEAEVATAAGLEVLPLTRAEAA
jgi:error-prone DNA polymerase